ERLRLRVLARAQRDRVRAGRDEAQLVRADRVAELARARPRGAQVPRDAVDPRPAAARERLDGRAALLLAALLRRLAVPGLAAARPGRARVGAGRGGHGRRALVVLPADGERDVAADVLAQVVRDHGADGRVLRTVELVGVGRVGVAHVEVAGRLHLEQVRVLGEHAVGQLLERADVEDVD